MSKILDRAGARAFAESVRASGRKIAFTNGCFDLLHAGHARLLIAARAEADVLIVGINSDESVRAIKGEGRPVVNQEDRAFMLSLYPFVDAVVVFSESTPLALLAELRPDVLVKGGDYTTATVVGNELVTTWGGRVALAPLVPGRSSSTMLRRAAEAKEQ